MQRPAPPVLLSFDDVLDATMLTAGEVVFLVHQGEFPRPQRSTDGHPGWLESDIGEWLENLPTTDELPVKNPIKPVVVESAKGVVLRPDELALIQPLPFAHVSAGNIWKQ